MSNASAHRPVWLTIIAAVIFLIAAAPVSAQRAGAAVAALVIAAVVRGVYLAFANKRRTPPRPLVMPSLFILAALFAVVVVVGDT